MKCKYSVQLQWQLVMSWHIGLSFDQYTGNIGTKADVAYHQGQRLLGHNAEAHGVACLLIPWIMKRLCVRFTNPKLTRCPNWEVARRFKIVVSACNDPIFRQITNRGEDVVNGSIPLYVHFDVAGYKTWCLHSEVKEGGDLLFLYTLGKGQAT